MGRIQRRDAAEIRERALATAVAKHEDGCEGCAAAYLEVARAHGATEADVRRAGMGRRRFLAFAGAALATAGVASVAGFTLSRGHEAKHKPLASGTYPGSYGVDSCTPLATAQQMPLHFYIGQLGATENGLGCFDAATADHVGAELTHGYWGLCGPNNANDPAAYGAEQARMALAARRANARTGGRTLFADVEMGYGGWGDSATQRDHAALLDAWLKTVAAAGYVPGVYINNSDRDTWFPEDYVAAVPFVYWVAGGPQAGTMCAPCDTGCDTIVPVRQLWNDHVSGETFGGYRAVLWQYWLSDFGCGGDFNFAPRTADNGLTPVSAHEAALLASIAAPTTAGTPGGAATP